MATPASLEALKLTGNLSFGKGGISADYLVGAFVKSTTFANGVWTFIFQDAAGVKKQIDLPPGWVVSATEPGSPYTGQGWYDTNATTLKIYDGSSFESLTGTQLSDGSVTTDKLKDGAVTEVKLATDAVTTDKVKDNAIDADKLADNSVVTDAIKADAVTKAKLAANSVDTNEIVDDAVTVDKLADNAVSTNAIANNAVNTAKLSDDSVTPAKLDADDGTKQDAFLTRLNALRRDLKNIATLTTAEQRTLLLATGTLLDGPRPAPSSAYAGRTWIDDHNDRIFVCRNRQEVKTAVGGLWSDANTTPVGIEIAENLADLDDAESNTDYAYTYGDNKWWKGTTVAGTDVWRETQPTTALSGRLTLTPNWNTVWLGQHRWDYNATQQLPHDALPANTDYYFFNTRTVTVRKFSLAGYSAAGTLSDHWQWESLIATAADIDIIEARDGNLPALANDGTDDRQIAIANDGIHFVQLIPEASTPATTGAWASYSFVNTNPYRRYIGVIAEDPASSTVGDFYYSTTRRRWRIYRTAGRWAWFNDHWEDLSDEDIAWPVRFIGNHGSRAEATAYAASSGIKTGQTFVAFTGSQIETGSQFFQGASARFSRHWRFLPLNPPTHTAQLFLDDVFSMPGGPSESVDIETGNSGRNYKTVYRLDHTVRMSKIKIAVSGEHAQGSEDWRLTLLKGFAPNASDENTIHVSDVLWPVNIEQRKHDQFTAPVLVTTPHTFDIPEVIVKRGEYLVVQLARVSTLRSASRVRVVRDLTEHHTFEAFRYLGSGTDNLDSGVAANYGIDNVEWADAGLWIEIEYAIEYDVGAAVAAHGNDDFTQVGAFSLSGKELSLRLTRELGGIVDVPEVDLTSLGVPDNDSIGEGKLTNDVKAKLQSDSDVATIADARALIRYTAPEKTKLSGAAPLANPTFTGKPKAPTPLSAGDDTEIATKKYVDDNAAAGGGGTDTVARNRIAAEITNRQTADQSEATVRGNADVALGNRITSAGNTSDDADTILGDAATALGKRIDALVASSGLVDTNIFDGDVAGSTSNVLRQLYHGAAPPVTDNIVVPETGDLLFMVYSKSQGYSGHFQIAAKDFITKTGIEDGTSGQGEGGGFAFPIGQNRSFTVTHRIVNTVKRFLWATQHNANLTWHLKIIHLTPAKSSAASKINYKPGLAPFRFVGVDRTAAVAAREKYFAGVVSLSQAYVNIYSAGMTSYIQVTLDSSTIEQLGAAGNAWNLVLGTDHTNTSVTVTPNTPLETFTLRLPDAGITLDALSGDLDHGSRLRAQVVGDGNALVDYAATWGANPTVGSVSPFSHGGDQITTERTAWRAEYIANPNFVLVLDYGILEEYQHWKVAVAPAVSDWETVLTLIKPPVSDYSPGLTPNIFRGANRAAAVAALDEYLVGVSLITQASLRIYSNANNYITVTLNAVVAVGTKGNKWSLRWGGDSSSAGEIDLNTIDSLFRATLKWDSNNSTLADIHAEFSRDSKFSSVVTGDDTLVASINETFGSDLIGNTVFFTGGLRTHTDTHVWFSHYADDPLATVTLEYESRQEMQVWDAALVKFRTVFTLLDSPTKPNPWTVLTHPTNPTDDYQWALSVTTSEGRVKERRGGTVKSPTFPSATDAVPLFVPTNSKEVYVRLTNGDETDSAYIPMMLLKPAGTVNDPHVSFALKDVLMQLRISLDGHVLVKRATTGTTIIGCDIWYR